MNYCLHENIIIPNYSKTNVLTKDFWLKTKDGWRTPKLLDGFNYKSKGEDNERRKSWGALLGS
jgi:hypothetical protein